MQELDELREEIDEIDKALTELFERRMETVLKIAQYKKERSIPILNKNREREVVNKNLNYLKNKKFKGALEAFFNNTMEISRKLQGEESSKENNTSLKHNHFIK